MKVSGGMTEGGIVIGNTYDKYNSRNPVVRRIMAGFHAALDELVDAASPGSIHEVGCGEGYWVTHWHRQGFAARGSDFSASVVALANENAIEQGLPQDLFAVQSVYELDAERDAADLVVCCEVLEHLEDPAAALERLRTVAGRYLIVSVPREPLWSLMNLARGRYWSQFGNTPGHIQRWTQREFVDLVSGIFRIESLRAPIPWTMLLCAPKDAA